MEFTEQDKVYGKQYLVDLVEKQSQILYRQKEIKVDVHLEDGSLKVYICVAVAYIPIAIGEYGSFRSGLDYLKKDTQAIYQTLTRDLEKNGLSKASIKKIKVNSGVVDKIKRLVIRLKKLEKNKDNNPKILKEIVNIRRYTEKILQEIDNEEDRAFIMKELYQLDSSEQVYRDRVPQPRPKFNPANIFIRNEEENEMYLYELDNINMCMLQENDELNKLKKLN